MKELETLVNRLKKIGIDITFLGNFPWVYVDKINGKKVVEKYNSDHGFVLGLLTLADKLQFSNTTELFKIIRKYK